MVSLILMKKILSLFLVMFMGILVVRLDIMKAEQSKSLSMLSLYLIMPCMILSSFQVDCTPQVRDGLILAFIAAVLLHVGLILLSVPAGKLLCLDPVEKTSLIYSNAAGLIVPLIIAVLGKEYVIYTCAFVSVQLFLLWSHCKSVLCGENKPDLKKVFTNINMVAILVGIVIFLTGLRFPGPVEDAVESVGSMVGPVGMLVTGMLIGGMDLKKVLSYKRILLIAPLRLVVVPLAALIFLKFSGLARLAEGGETVLLISLMATMTPSASTITQMAQVYGRDADYASAINVVTTILCVVTMPVLLTLYLM